MAMPSLSQKYRLGAQNSFLHYTSALFFDKHELLTKGLHNHEINNNEIKTQTMKGPRSTGQL